MAITATGILTEGGDVSAASKTSSQSPSVVAGRVYLLVLHAGFSGGSSGVPSSVTGPGGLSFTLLASTGEISTFSNGSVWIGKASSSGSGTVTATWPGTVYFWHVQLIELGGSIDTSGANGANAVRQSVAGTAGTSPTTTTLATMLAGNIGLVAGFAYSGGSSGETATADWASEIYDNSATFFGNVVANTFTSISADSSDPSATVTWSPGGAGATAYAAIALELSQPQVQIVATSQLRLVEWTNPPAITSGAAALAAPATGAAVEGLQDITPNFPLKWLRWDNGSPIAFDVGWFEGRAGGYKFGLGATAPNVLNGPAATATGTAVAATWNPANAGQKLWRVSYPTTATAGALGGVRAAANMLAASVGYLFRAAFVLNEAAAVSGARAFVGLSNSTAAPTNVEANTLTNCIGVGRISSDNTQLYLFTGGSAAQTAVALGTGFPPFSAAANGTNGVPYELWIVTDTSNNSYWVLRRLDTLAYTSGQLTGTAGTARPASTTTLSPRAWCTNNATALATSIEVADMSWLRLAA